MRSFAADSKLTYRGCIPKDKASPFDDGWQTKNKCKTVSGIRTCTCKPDDMCNTGARNVASAAGALALIGTSAALLWAI